MTPKKQERLFDVSYARVLLSIADGDRRTVAALLHASDIRFENAFFLAQQSLEKALKAVLVARQIPVPMVHDLGALLAKLPGDLNPPYGYELNDLSEYAGVRRHEEGHWSPGPDDLRQVYAVVVDMLEWAEGVVNGKETTHPV